LMFFNLSKAEQDKILDYQLLVCVCEPVTITFYDNQLKTVDSK